MSTICGHCRLPIANGETGVRHFGHYVAHTENRCVSLLSAEIERLRARVASLEESLHYANGVADLAIKHRDDAEKRVAELERTGNAVPPLAARRVIEALRKAA